MTKMRWQVIDGPRKVRGTEQQVREWVEMARWPGDRPVEKQILTMLQKAWDLGQFRPPEWSWCRCLETGLIYRMNGKHSSLTLMKNLPLPEDFVISITGYECPTLADAASLYATFDQRRSGRSSKAIYSSYASTVPELDGITRSVIQLAVAGISFAVWENQSNRGHDNDVRSAKMLEHPQFVIWLNEMVGGHGKDSSVWRSPVVAAMFKTWLKHGQGCTSFWLEVMKEDNPDPKSSSRVLKRWLLSAVLASYRSRDRSIKNCGHHEMMVRCLHAWNAYKRNQTTNLNYYANKPTPDVA